MKTKEDLEQEDLSYYVALVAEKDKEIEELKKKLMYSDGAVEQINSEYDKLNKLWQKRFEWLKKILDEIIKYNNDRWLFDKIDEAQNKEFDEVKERE